MVELIVAAAIIGILATIAIPAYNGYRDKLRIDQAIADIRMIENRLATYYSDNLALPDCLGNPGSVQNSSGSGNGNGGAGGGGGPGGGGPGGATPLTYLGGDFPIDPWGNPYQYLRIDGGGAQGKSDFRKDKFLNPINTDYDLYSMGKDGLSQKPLNVTVSQDDIIRAHDGGFVGLASDFSESLIK